MFNDQFTATRAAIRRLHEIRAEHASKAAEAKTGDNSPPSSPPESVPAAAGPASGAGLDVRLRIDPVPVGTPLNVTVVIDLREGSASAVSVSPSGVAW